MTIIDQQHLHQNYSRSHNFPTHLSRLNEEETDSSEEEDSVSQAYSPWIEWFLSQPAHDFFVEIDEEYILDRFNLTGLTSISSHFQRALDRITKHTDEDEDEREAENAEQMDHNRDISNAHGIVSMDTTMLEDEKRIITASNEHHTSITESEIQNTAIHLYGLIHARYIITSTGMNKMFEKFRTGIFGKCPRVFCRSFSLVPVGLSDIPGQSSVQLYCAHCEDVYRPRSNRYNTIDGAYFGTSFPHLFFQCFKQTIPRKSLDHYVPKIFGFRLYSSQKELYSLNEEISKKDVGIDKMITTTGTMVP